MNRGQSPGEVLAGALAGLGGEAGIAVGLFA